MLRLGRQLNKSFRFTRQHRSVINAPYSTAMAAQYAKNQPSGYDNTISRVAIVGVSNFAPYSINL